MQKAGLPEGYIALRIRLLYSLEKLHRGEVFVCMMNASREVPAGGGAAHNDSAIRCRADVDMEGEAELVASPKTQYGRLFPQ